jgi:hypothetical protein
VQKIVHPRHQFARASHHSGASVTLDLHAQTIHRAIFAHCSCPARNAIDPAQILRE